jgi:hypothetical protein
MNGSSERTGRDGRLLALVIVVSLAVLLVLAKFRFPLAAGVTTAPPAPGPLERLAARSTYDDLAATIANLVQQLTPKVAVVQLGLVPPEEKPGGKKGAAPEPIFAAPPRLAAAIRVGQAGQDLAVTYLPPGYQVTGGQGLAAQIDVLASDPIRTIAVVRVPSVFESSSGTAGALAEFQGFSYVAIVEAAPGGLSATPFFVGRVDPTPDSAWPTPIRAIGGSPTLPPGALVFSLDSRFIGLAVATPNGGRALVPAAALDAAALALMGGGKIDRP